MRLFWAGLAVLTYLSALQADPPAVIGVEGKPAASQSVGLNLTPVSAASVPTPARGKTIFLDADTGKISAKDSEGKVTVLEVVQPPTPDPVPAPKPESRPGPAPVPKSGSAERKLLGGWRVANSFGRGTVAFDWSRMTMAMAGHAQRNEILLYSLPAPGTGTDVSRWPIVKPNETIKGWWPGDCYASGLIFWKGDWWVSPRKFYDTSPPNTQTWYSRKGQTVPWDLPRQQFHGFMKRFGEDPLPAGGGTESGQGAAFGPCLATFQGQKKIVHNYDPAWANRAPREPNYWPKGHKDEWTALEPREVKGKKEGRWACDRIFAGGLKLSDGYYFWPLMGIGDIDYARQNETFAAENKTYEYRYGLDYKLVGWKETTLGPIHGQDFGPGGEVILVEGNRWQSEVYQVDPVVGVWSNPGTKSNKPGLLDGK